jgi:hypothetical protein
MSITIDHFLSNSVKAREDLFPMVPYSGIKAPMFVNVMPSRDVRKGKRSRIMRHPKPPPHIKLSKAISHHQLGRAFSIMHITPPSEILE